MMITLKIRYFITTILVSFLFISSCERRRHCKNVDGLEFNENIIELMNKGTDELCISTGEFDNPILINDTNKLKQYLLTNSNYCSKKPSDYDFGQFSIITFSTKFPCKNHSIRFELVDNGSGNFKLEIYKCGRKSCGTGPNITGDYVFKVKKISTSNLDYEIHD